MEYQKEEGGGGNVGGGGGGPIPMQMPMPGPPPLYSATMVIPVLGPYPMSIKCPHCYVQTFSEVNYSSGLATYLLSGGCCLLGGALGCFLIPFCLDSAKDVHHFCPHCKNFIGRYKRIG